MSDERAKMIYGPMMEAASVDFDDLGPEDFVMPPGYVMVLPLDPIKRTSKGIELPDAYAIEQMAGRVVLVPDDEKCRYEIGDLVVYRSLGVNITLGRKNYKVLQYFGDDCDEICLRLKRNSEKALDNPKMKLA